MIVAVLQFPPGHYISSFLSLGAGETESLGNVASNEPTIPDTDERLVWSISGTITSTRELMSLVKNLPHPKSHMNWSAIEPRPL